MADDAPVASGSGAEGAPHTIVIREKAKRGARACIQCRKLKKTCEGGAAPCVRCKASGATCVFDKPASSVVEDAGLSRLASIEASLATSERRMDTVWQQMGEISNTLTEVLARLKALSGQPPTSSPAAMAFPSPFGSGPFDLTSQPTPPGLGGRGSLSLSGAGATGSPYQPISNLPPFPNLPHTNPSTIPKPRTFDPAPPAPPSSSSSAKGDYSSGLDALASLASRDAARFASRMGQPITALADAAAQLNDGDVKPDVGSAEASGEPEASGGAAGAKQDETSGRGDGEPPAKRSKVTPQAQPLSPDQFDLVAKGLITDQDARALVLLWMKELQPFCSVLDPKVDTYESLRRRSPFLFNVVVYTTLRAQERNAPPSKALLAAAEETRRFAQNQVFQTPQLEDVQAIFIMACYHQEPYILSGMGFRLALSARFDSTWSQIQAHGVDKTDEKAQRLTAQFRTWIYILQLEFKHSRYLGRMVLIQQHHFDTALAEADKLLSLPLSNLLDVRHVANLRLVGIERQILNEVAQLDRDGADFSQRVAYVHEKAKILASWQHHYDTIIIGFAPSPLAWPRKSHSRMYHDSSLLLFVNVFKERLLEGAAANPELNQIAQMGLTHARNNLQTVIGSPVYRDGARWSGYLLRVDLTFAAIFLMKSAEAYPHLVDRDEVAKDVQQLADLLATLAGSQRYSAMLRVAREQYLARTGPALNPPTADDLAPVSAPSPASASLRSILMPPIPTISAPHSSFSSASTLPAFAPSLSTATTSAALAAGATSLAPASFPPPVSAANGIPGVPFQPLGAATGTAALLPGELDYNWDLAVPPSLFDDPGVLLTHDWTATVGGIGNWLDGL
ncbi:hypothetical protein JCM8097_004842 [Rhodosporidiobolus ruineniae]